MDKPNLELVYGGLLADLGDAEKQFDNAYITNTRLMGVLVIYAHWILPKGPCKELHQFFYIDCEENGLENYISIRGKNEDLVSETEQYLIGGLGGIKVPLSQRKLMWLLQHWAEFNKKWDLPLPKKFDEWSFLLEKKVNLTKAENSKLIRDYCEPIENDYQVVNYFLMRCFGRDYEGARYLTQPTQSGRLTEDFPLDLYDAYIKATFLKNTIEKEKKYGDGAVSYLCESMIEMGGNYEIVISKVVVRDLEVIGFEHCSSFPISDAEVAFNLTKQEYFSTYNLLMSSSEIQDNIGEFAIGLDTVMSKHDNGYMFMAFRKTNSHVKEQVYMLSNDVEGMYFLTLSGQLIVMANSVEDLEDLEDRLNLTPLFDLAIPIGEYSFHEPVMMDFVNSPFLSFDYFVEMTTEDL